MTVIQQLRLRSELYRVRKSLLALPHVTASLSQRLRLTQQANQIHAELNAGTVHTTKEERP